MRKYELTYIVRPDLDAGALAALIERVNGFVTAEGGVVSTTTQWGLRPLSYPIRKYREGVYVFSVLELQASSLARIDQRLRLTEDIIRYLLVRADDHNDVSSEPADIIEGAAVESPATDEPPAAESAEVPEAQPASSAA